MRLCLCLQDAPVFSVCQTRQLAAPLGTMLTGGVQQGGYRSCLSLLPFPTPAAAVPCNHPACCSLSCCPLPLTAAHASRRPTDLDFYEDGLARTPPFEGFWHVQVSGLHVPTESEGWRTLHLWRAWAAAKVRPSRQPSTAPLAVQ